MRTPNTYAYFVATFTPVNKFRPRYPATTPEYAGPTRGGIRYTGSGQLLGGQYHQESPSFFELNLRLAYDFNLYNDVTLQQRWCEKYL